MIKNHVYRVCRCLGGFRLARRVTRRALRILAYHGFALRDECRFRRQLFIDPGVFRQRMEYLVRQRYPVLPLAEAVDRLLRGDLPDAATVITIDDGFHSAWKLAAPVLRELDLPATIYATTYYSTKGSPVFRLVVQYMFWKTTQTELDAAGLGLPDAGRVGLSDAASADAFMWRIIEHAETRMAEDERIGLSRELGQRLGVSYSRIVDERLFTLMTEDELRQAAQAGIDIELHTHRHRVPAEPGPFREEIEKNRDVLEGILGRPPRHLCYPSGVHFSHHRPLLAQLGVVSATTCDAGLNYPDTPPLALRRFLDGDNISPIVFEAEMCGFAELLRIARSPFRRRPAAGPSPS